VYGLQLRHAYEVKIYFSFATRGCPMWLDVVTFRTLGSKPQGGEAVNVAKRIVNVAQKIVNVAQKIKII
jgi:hypothetical protein